MGITSHPLPLYDEYMHKCIEFSSVYSISMLITHPDNDLYIYMGIYVQHSGHKSEKN